MAIKHSPGCGCCVNCDFGNLQYVSPTETDVVTDGTATVLSPTFQNYNHYRFNGDLFADFMTSDATRTVTMEFISTDENTVYDTITWQHNNKWDLFNKTRECERSESGEIEYSYRGGFGFEKSNGDQFTTKSSARDVPAAASLVSITSVSSSDTTRDTIGNDLCIVKAYPSGEVDRPCQLDQDSTCPCETENKAGSVEWAISHDSWATSSNASSIPSFNMYRLWHLTFDDDSCVNLSNASCSGLTQARTNQVVYNYSGIQSSSTDDWSNGTQTKTTSSSSNSGQTTSGYGGYVAMTPVCPTSHYSQASTTISVSNFTDAGSGPMNVSIHQQKVKALSGGSVTLQLTRNAADIACDVVVADSNGSTQTITMGVNELVKTFSVTAVTTTTGKEEPLINDFLASPSSSSKMNGIRVKEDVIEFDGGLDMVAHNKCIMNTEGATYGHWFPIDRKSWTSVDFKIRLTNSGGDISYSSYDSKIIKNDDLDCYDGANTQCPPEYVCSEKAEFHYNPITAGNFAGAVSSEFPDKLRTEVDGCTTNTILQDFSADDLLDVGYGGVKYIYSTTKYSNHDVDTNSIVIPYSNAPADGNYNTPFGAYCFNDGNTYYYASKFRYDGWPSGYVNTVSGYWGIVEGVIQANLTCGTTAATTSEIDYVQLSNVGTNAFQRSNYWNSIAGSFQSNAGNGASFTSNIYTSGSCDVASDNEYTQTRQAGSNGIDSVSISATVVKPTESSTWPPSIAVPTDSTNDVYITSTVFTGLMFGEDAVSGYFDDFLGQTEFYITDDISLPDLQSTNYTDLIDDGETLWIEIQNSSDPAEDGFYSLINNAGTVEADVATKTSTQPTLSIPLVGIEASIIANHLASRLFESGPLSTDVYGSDPVIANGVMTYQHIVGGRGHANGLSATQLDNTGGYQYESGGRAKWLSDNSGCQILGYLGDADTYVYRVGPETSGADCAWSNQYTPQSFLANSQEWGWQAWDASREIYWAHESGLNFPRTCDGFYTTQSGQSQPPEAPEPSRTDVDFLSEDHKVYVYDRTISPIPEPWTAASYTQSITWTQAFGASDVVTRGCCNSETPNSGTLTGWYFDWTNAYEYQVNWSHGFDRLLETRSVLSDFSDGDYPWDGVYLKESNIDMKKKWIDCWEGMPTNIGTLSYSSSDFVSGQDPINIYQSTLVENIRSVGSVVNNEYDAVIADVTITTTEADFSTLTFDLTGLSW